MEEENSTVGGYKVKVIVFNECRYPKPPSKYTTEVPVESTLAQLRTEITRITSYKGDLFDFGAPLKNVDNEELVPLTQFVDTQKMQDPAYRKILIRIVKRNGTKDTDFLTDEERQEDKRNEERRSTMTHDKRHRSNSIEELQEQRSTKNGKVANPSSSDDGRRRADKSNNNNTIDKYLRRRRTRTEEDEEDLEAMFDDESPRRSLTLNRRPKEYEPGKMNMLFYSNKIPSVPSGDLIDNIHTKWYDNWGLLEQHHGYIQWLFPVFENSGLNWDSDALDKNEARLMRKDPNIAKRIVKSYQMMLHFYGMELSEPKAGLVVRSQHWQERYKHLNSSFHNYLRINRILTSLGHLGFTKFKRPWVEFLENEIVNNGQLKNAKSSLNNYWKKTLLVDSKEFKAKTLETAEDREDSVFFTL